MLKLLEKRDRLAKKLQDFDVEIVRFAARSKEARGPFQKRMFAQFEVMAMNLTRGYLGGEQEGSGTHATEGRAASATASANARTRRAKLA